MMDLKLEMKERCAYIEAALEKSVPEQQDFPPVIFEAMRYSLLAGGKRLRPMMVLAACERSPLSSAFSQMLLISMMVRAIAPSMEKMGIMGNVATSVVRR